MSDHYQENGQSLFAPQAMETRNEAASPVYADLQNLCRKYMNYHVIAQMADGSKMEGIIEDVTNQGVVMLVPENVDDTGEADSRGFYGGTPRRRFRRFNRFLFPFLLFSAPFFLLYPYYY